MKCFLIRFGVLFMQVSASLACFIVLYMTAGIPVALFVDAVAWHCGAWREYFAHLSTIVAALYVSFRIGFHFAEPSRPTTWNDLRFLSRVAVSLLAFWVAVFAGVFDLVIYAATAVGGPSYSPIGAEPESSSVAWIRVVVLFLLGLIMVITLARWCVGPAHFRIR